MRYHARHHRPSLQYPLALRLGILAIGGSLLLACEATNPGSDKGPGVHANKMDAVPGEASAVGLVGRGDRTRGADVQHCVIERFKIYSPAMGRPIRVAVVLPPGYSRNGDTRLPVLYALHGYGAPYDTWAHMSTLREAIGEKPMAVVCFDGDRGGWYIDSPEKADSQFETFFFRELMPFVEARYRAGGNAARRGITGFSMGGYGAFQLMLSRPDAFAGVSSLSSGLVYMGETNGRPWRGLPELLGPYERNRQAYQKRGILNRLEDAARQGKPLPKLMLASGTEDRSHRLSGMVRD